MDGKGYILRCFCSSETAMEENLQPKWVGYIELISAQALREQPEQRSKPW